MSKGQLQNYRGFMLFPFFPFRRKKHKPVMHHDIPATPMPVASERVRRHFFNERGFQTYATFFAHWGGHITAGHALKDSGDILPPFARGTVNNWPGGLDAAVIGCQLPRTCPADPVPGHNVVCRGYPAGSAHAASRTAKIYMQRPGSPDTWIARIIEPDEPVVSGMSGGPVLDAHTGEPIGILITRNSPADLNNDRDPDESFDFISLAGVWRALHSGGIYV